MRMEWSDDLAVGWGEIDREHKELVGLAGELQTAILNCEPKRELQRRHDALAECAARHFTTEEGLMLATGYPKFDEHRAEHQRLLDQLGLVRGALHSDGAGGELLVTIMAGWTIPHIRGADQELAGYLARVRGA